MANIMAVHCLVLFFTVYGFLQCSVTAHNTQRVVDVRLYNGSNSYSGTLQLRSLTPLTDWQDFSCDSRIYSWRVFAVACRMLGFENVVSFPRTAIYINGNFLSMYRNCRGIETDINDCSGSYSYTTYCQHRYEIVCSTCAIGAVRLTNGLIPQQGTVEICFNGSWSRVCNVNWGYQDSLVVCRQLGYPTSKLGYFTTNTYIGTHTGYILSNFGYNCVGSENRLYDCSRGTYSTCVQQHSVGELRSVILTCMVQTPVTSCTNGAIRLSGGRDRYEGRVEVCSNRAWAIISRSGWDSNDAVVACRQLGLLQPHTLTRITMPSFSPGEGSIFFDNLRCSGSENRLIDCPKSSYYYISRYQAGVRCQFNPSSVHNFCNGNVRLVGGNSVSEGRVEICYNGVWGSVCNHGWSNIDAAIVCRQLGFQGENSTAIRDLRYGEGSGPYILSYVNCRGHERNLTECNYWNSQISYHDCSSEEDAGIICDASTCQHGDVRLYGGYSKSDGLAEICINGKWTKICYNGYVDTTSIKFCRQLLGRENVVAPYGTCCSRVGSTSLSSLHNVRCDPSSPERLVDCSYSISNSSCSRLIVGCYANDSCDTGSVRLVNGTTMFEGIVEVCLNGVWGTIISSGWNTPDAEVVCRQLGLSWGWSQYDISQKNDANSSIYLLQSVNCVGDEDTLFNCAYRKVSSSQLTHYYSIAAVLCQGSTNQSNNPNQCISGDVRLANSSNNIEGRVEICTEGMWVSVCDRNWRRFETRLFCKQLLGHPAKGSFYVTGGYYGTGNSPIISRVNCYNSNSFNSCTITHQGGRCSHGQEVGVVCLDSDYVVTVTSFTDPPFKPGSNVELHCSINPDPSVGKTVQLYYRWRGNDGQFSHYSSSPNVTIPLTVTHYKASYYYCEVSVTGYFIEVGSILIETADILYPVEEFSPSDGQTFNLSVNATDEIQFIARELNWYINGILITNSYYNIILTNGNKTLMTTVGVPGVYEVRYDGLLALPHNHECEKMFLSGMRHYPMLRPVRFLVNTTEEVIPLSSTITILSDNIGQNVFTDGDTIALRVLGQTSLSIEPRDIQITWSLNGIRQAYFSRGQMYGEIVRTNATNQFAGKYEVLLLWNLGSSQQCNQYYNSLRQQTSFNLYEVILAKSGIDLKYYESLNHSFTATKPSLSSREVSLLTCSATIHYPPLTSISIVKNKIILKTTADTLLRVSTDSLGVSPFGSYQCRVNATGVMFTQQLTIKEKVSLRLELNIKQPLKCSKDDDIVEVMESSIATKLNNDCSCNVTTDDLRDTKIECNSESSMIFTTLLVFSTESSDETASILANRLSQQVSSGLAIGINGSEAQVTSACIDDCYQSTGHDLDSVGVNIGVFFGGVIFSAMFTALCIKLFIMFRRKSLKKSSPLTVTATGKGDVRYDTGKSKVKVNLKNESKEARDAVYEVVD